MRSIHWRMIPLIVFSMLVIFFGRGLFLDPHHLPSVQLGNSLPNFELPSLTGSTSIFTSKQMRGQITLLNVWASWCEACTQEQVFLLELAHQGIVIYGVNYKDNPDAARHWLTEWGNPYTGIGSDRDGHVAMDLGVYGAPETFLIDSNGVIRYRHVGILTANDWQQEFLPRIKTLRGILHAQ